MKELECSAMSALIKEEQQNDAEAAQDMEMEWRTNAILTQGYTADDVYEMLELGQARASDFCAEVAEALNSSATWNFIGYTFLKPLLDKARLERAISEAASGLER